ncbi:hypothetical protein MSPP1_001730 [Malassezia sp. CBS 17886]|nr:hypothetical protein MSPP1_001730 [Malassezia sp. CBS 17886]
MHSGEDPRGQEAHGGAVCGDTGYDSGVQQEPGSAGEVRASILRNVRAADQRAKRTPYLVSSTRIECGTPVHTHLTVCRASPADPLGRQRIVLTDTVARRVGLLRRMHCAIAPRAHLRNLSPRRMRDVGEDKESDAGLAADVDEPMDSEELAALNAIINTRRSMAAAQALAQGCCKCERESLPPARPRTHSLPLIAVDGAHAQAGLRRGSEPSTGSEGLRSVRFAPLPQPSSEEEDLFPAAPWLAPVARHAAISPPSGGARAEWPTYGTPRDTAAAVPTLGRSRSLSALASRASADACARMRDESTPAIAVRAWRSARRPSWGWLGHGMLGACAQRLPRTSSEPCPPHGCSEGPPERCQQRRRELVRASRPGGTGMVTLLDGERIRAKQVGDPHHERVVDDDMHAHLWGFAALERQRKRVSPGDSDSVARAMSASRAAEVRRRHEAEVAALGAEVLARVRRDGGSASLSHVRRGDGSAARSHVRRGHGSMATETNPLCGIASAAGWGQTPDPSVSVPCPLPFLPRRPDAKGIVVVPLPQLGRRPERPHEGRYWTWDVLDEDEDDGASGSVDGGDTHERGRGAAAPCAGGHAAGDAGSDADPDDAPAEPPSAEEIQQDEEAGRRQLLRRTVRAAGQEIVRGRRGPDRVESCAGGAEPGTWNGEYWPRPSATRRVYNEWGVG